MSSRLSWTIIKYFSHRNRFGFAIQDVVRELPVRNRVHPAWIHTEMVHLKEVTKMVNAACDNYFMVIISLIC